MWQSAFAALLLCGSFTWPSTLHACESAFYPPFAFGRVSYKTGTEIEVSFAMDINPDHTILISQQPSSEAVPIHIHRLNGEDIPFDWPPGHRFVEGATPADTRFFTQLQFTIFVPGTHWTFYPEHPETSIWRSVLARLDRVIDFELQNGVIDQGIAQFAKNYHHGVMNRHVSHIFLKIPTAQKDQESWETLSIIHGGAGGGNFAGPYQEPLLRHSPTPSLLQIEASFPDLVLPERQAFGEKAEIYEFVRLASVGLYANSTLDQLAAVAARHLAQKNGFIPVVNRHAGIYFLVPTKAHERHYKSFFEKRQISMQKIADVGDGLMVYRIPLFEFVEYYMSVTLEETSPR